MYFSWISEQTASIFLYSFNLSVFKNEAESVYCAVPTGSLNQTDKVSYLKGELSATIEILFFKLQSNALLSRILLWTWSHSFCFPYQYLPYISLLSHTCHLPPFSSFLLAEDQIFCLRRRLVRPGRLTYVGWLFVPSSNMNCYNGFSLTVPFRVLRNLASCYTKRKV